MKKLETDQTDDVMLERLRAGLSSRLGESWHNTAEARLDGLLFDGTLGDELYDKVAHTGMRDNGTGGLTSS